MTPLVFTADELDCGMVDRVAVRETRDTGGQVYPRDSQQEANRSARRTAASVHRVLHIDQKMYFRANWI